MSISRRMIGLSLAMLMPSTLLLNPAAQAQTAAASAAPAAPADSTTVTVNGKRSATNDPQLITNAKSKVLNRNLASSCNFMSAYSAAEDDVTQKYMKDFNMEDSSSNDAERIRESAPEGDVSSIVDSSSIEKEDAAPAADPTAGACSGADKKMAAGRNYIARKDKSLAEGFVAFDANDYAGATKLFTTAFNKVGYDEAALMLARMQLYGLGTPQNTPAALTWLHKVVDHRYDPVADRLQYNPEEPANTNDRVEACLTLAKIYLTGIGVAKNPAEAKKWYSEAVDSGFIPANNTLGQAYLNGYGGQKDIKKAMAYFTTAAEAGYAPAQYNLGKIYYAGADGVPQNLKQAGAWFAAAAKTGHAGALFAAGRMYDLGEGVPVDQQKAIVYYKEAALKSNPGAQSAMGTYFYTGQMVPKDLATARKFFSAAALKGQPDAMFNLAVMNARGEGGEKNPMMAYVWMSLAKDAGHESAEAGMKAVKSMLSAQDLEKAQAILKPKAKS
ncbi:MAG: tetratricopeptide repeat protein [Massilia sp.]